jgi:hypothetical protein
MSFNDGWYLNLTVSVADPPGILTAFGAGRYGDDVQVAGSLTTPAIADVADEPLSLLLTAEQQERIGLIDEDGSLRFTFDGEPTTATLAQTLRLENVHDRYELSAGSVENRGRRVEFMAITDPLPPVAIGGLVLVGGCAALGGLSYGIEKIQAKTSGFNKKCWAEGGTPVVKPQFGLRFNPFKGEFGCTVKAQMECLHTDGGLISSEELAEEDLED